MFVKREDEEAFYAFVQKDLMRLFVETYFEYHEKNEGERRGQECPEERSSIAA